MATRDYTGSAGEITPRVRTLLKRAAASLIGCLGQAPFPSLLWGLVAHPGHASLRSLGKAWLASLHACVGLALESLALGRASRWAAAIFGFIYYPTGNVYMPERARTSSGEDDPVRVWWWAVQVMSCPPPLPDGTQCHLPTCGAAPRLVCAPRRLPRAGVPWYASGASPMT